MNWKQLLAERRVEQREATKKEIDEIRETVLRTLEDAEIGLEAGQSSGRCFNIAYDAARMVAVQAVRCAGYRVKSSHGAHFYTFQALGVALGSHVAQFIDYFDDCREKRNEVCYDWGEVTECEATEILERTIKLRDMVESWIATERPDLGKILKRD
ncbi:hypothetical protein OAO01_04745 [Oligoflexia bacterium]|nr:hypothetical protein [Oligoflexia bacterium]